MQPFWQRIALYSTQNHCANHWCMTDRSPSRVEGLEKAHARKPDVRAAPLVPWLSRAGQVGGLVVCTKDRSMPQPKRKIRLLNCTGGAVGRTRQHERLGDPSSKQSDPSSSASPSCIMGRGVGGIARNDCHMQALTNSHRSSSSSAFSSSDNLWLCLCAICTNSVTEHTLVCSPTCSQRPRYVRALSTDSS